MPVVVVVSVSVSISVSGAYACAGEGAGETGVTGESTGKVQLAVQVSPVGNAQPGTRPKMPGAAVKTQSTAV